MWRPTHPQNSTIILVHNPTDKNWQTWTHNVQQTVLSRTYLLVPLWLVLFWFVSASPCVLMQYAVQEVLTSIW